jgi:glutamyl-tRNA reductase
MELVVVGLSHRTSPVEIRERLAMNHGEAEGFVRELIQTGTLAEGIVVSTCNRVEIYGLARQPMAAIESLSSSLAEFKQIAPTDLIPCLYKQHGTPAVEHLFSVTASLESLVVGEPQILGQVKEAYAAAQTAQTTGPGMNRLMHRAFSVAKRVRTETQISRLAVSISSVAVDLARKIFQRLEQHTAMLVGAGEMAELAARHFSGAGIKELFILNRTYERAAGLAQEFQATAVPFEKLHAYLAEVDIALFSAGAPHHLVRGSEIEQIMRQRKQRPLFLIDIAVPRNVDPLCGEVDNVFLYDVDDLQQVADGNKALRLNETEAARAIVREESEKYAAYVHAQQAFPVIARLTARAEALRKAELERTLNGLGGEADPVLAEKLNVMTAAIVNKLLHGPIQAIKEAQSADDTEALELVRKMFRLEEEPQASAKPGEPAGQRKKA